MGKNRKEKRAGKVEDYTDDDTLSTTSTGASSDVGGPPEVEEECDESTLMDSFVEALYQKRASMREAGLKGLIEAFTGAVLTEFAEDKNETLSNRFINSVKVGGGAEAAQAARALGLLVITVGAGDSAKRILEDASPHFSKVARLGSSPASRASVLESMGILAFVGAADMDTTESTMAFLWTIISHKYSLEDQKTGINTPPGPVKVAALVSWSLLLSTLDSQRVSSHHLQPSLPVLSSLLSMEDLGVRTAAGEAIALLYEITDTSISVDGDDDDDVDTYNDVVPPTAKTTNTKVASGGKALLREEDQVVEQMKALSVHAARKGQPRKERAVQRSAFRELLAAIEDGVAPEVSVKLPAGNVLKFNTWTQIIQLNMLRRFLGEGFQTHMQENTLLHEVFDFVPQAERRKNLTTTQKRMLQSPNSVVSKARTEVMNRRRSYSQARNMGIYDINGNESE